MAATLPKIIVRPIELKDAAPVAAMRIEAVSDYPLAFTADLAETQSRPAEWWRDLAARAGGHETELVLVADTGDSLAGMLGVVVPKAPKLAHVGTIWGVYVRPPFRGRGIAQQMLGEAINWGRSRSLAMLKLSVVAGNDAALRCYQRCGFTLYGTEPSAVRWDRLLHDEHLMAIRLCSSDS